MKRTANQRRVLAMLSDAGQRGRAEAIMAPHFGGELLAGLVRAGLARVDVRAVRADRSRVEIVRLKITDAGRRAIGRWAPHGLAYRRRPYAVVSRSLPFGHALYCRPGMLAQ
jgi:hypothetical protein